ncbi:hypothetical protein BC749_1184 [Flavobacterium araucananum]|uniref:Uncharacterized protein n=1 Tax=Flavobacterium araucananum TaxID=946678 RepID=A0A227PA04_9FLAO|nr:hypothetical protein [Flavobacterium araucananum]OXG06078.1 hypothetical protein B0A64_11855 [Flavobacterium araucananum]PWJ92105.1 hypothetical protein BC749_1184 [Flavobacterium araucananum]
MNIKIIKSDIVINRPVSEVFTLVFKMDHIVFFKNMPSVPIYTYNPGISENARPGSDHFIYFIKGDTARHTLASYVPGTSFSAVIDQLNLMNYPGLFEIEYQYNFCKNLDKVDTTQISCEYQFKFRSSLTALLFTLNALKCAHKYTAKHMVQIGKAFC